MEEISCVRARKRQKVEGIERKLPEKRWIFHEEDEGKNQQAHVYSDRERRVENAREERENENSTPNRV
jgi:hypothetical protein